MTKPLSEVVREKLAHNEAHSRDESYRWVKDLGVDEKSGMHTAAGVGVYMARKENARLAPLHEALVECVEALERSDCDTVRNFEGSGMFNKHDPECRRCSALANLRKACGV